ncbi:MAG: toxin HicA [Chloroflexi bacterium]|nr:toxin HicA [Chloroflexota bacterium]
MDEAVARLRKEPRNVRFDELRKVCDFYLGEPRRHGSHLVYRTPWQGEPRINIQARRGMAKPYQVRQVLKAIEKLEEMR